MDIPAEAFDNRGPVVYSDLVQADLEWKRGKNTIGALRHIAPLALWKTEKPFCLTLPLPPGQPKSNVVADNHTDIHFCDVRGREQDFSLDRHGFAFDTLPPISVDIDDSKAVEEDYVQQMEEFLSAKMGADLVYIFDYTRRRRKPLGADYTGDIYRPPGNAAHIDQTPAAALSRMRLHFGEKCGDLLRGRLQLINLWRPIFGPVVDCPIAVCDARSLHSDDLVASDLVYPHYVGEKYDLKWSKHHRWYYLKDMLESECLLIKNYDTKMDGRARLCAHSAFFDATTPENARKRESIEVRAMVFHFHDQSRAPE